MDNKYDIVVFGDINLDWCTTSNLSLPFTKLGGDGTRASSPIEEIMGGSGLNFANFAKEIGFAPLLIGKIADDYTGKVILEWLKKHDMELGIVTTNLGSSGKVFITRDHRDIRLMIDNAPNSNRTLTIEDVEKYSKIIKFIPILYVSGYCFEEQKAPRVKAVNRAIEICKLNKKSHIIFDVAPHQLYKNYNFTEFKELTRDVTILISQVSSMRRFLNLGDSHELIDRQIASETIHALIQAYSTPISLILRFGPTGCNEQIVWNALEKKLSWDKTDHFTSKNKRGFGDRLALKTLMEKFSIKPKV